MYLPREIWRTETCKATKCSCQYNSLQTMGLFVSVHTIFRSIFRMKDRFFSMMVTDHYWPSIFLEEHTWMVVQHNNTELTRLRPSPGVNQHSIYFDYSTADEQLLAAISQSEHCEQELSYHCRRSRLLNTPGRGNPENVCPKQTLTCVLFEKPKISPNLWFCFYLKPFFFLEKSRTIYTQI